MKKLIVLSLCILPLAGCMAPNYARLIPENKAAHIMVFSPIYGWVVIDTRGLNDEKAAPPLAPLQQPPAVPKVTIGP